jgi:hypothetical protein
MVAQIPALTGGEGPVPRKVTLRIRCPLAAMTRASLPHCGALTPPLRCVVNLRAASRRCDPRASEDRRAHEYLFVAWS